MKKNRIKKRIEQYNKRTRDINYYINKFINFESIKEISLWAVVSVFLIYAVEFMARGNMDEVKLFLSQRDIAAHINLIIVMLFTGISFFARRKKFCIWIISCVILILGAVNNLVIKSRGMPFSFSDIFSISDALSIASKFISINMVIVAAALLLIFILVTILIWKKEKKGKRINGYITIFIYISLILTINGYRSIMTGDYMRTLAWDVTQTYENNGFIYSFAESYVGYLRKKPEGYSKDAILKIREEVENKAKNDSSSKIGSKKPNILFVQLEGFFDPSTIPGIEFNTSPTPVFNSLSEKYTSGYMDVPTAGGGTARTEFEVITGSSFKYLINGEIPYITIVNNKQVNSIATYMNNIGYKTHAVHDFEGNFYNRNKGLENLGFNTFTSYEYMNGIEKNPTGWPKDKVLTQYINEAMDSTKEKDLVCTVSVQAHSRYPSDRNDSSWPCKITKSEGITERQKKEIEYYAEQVREMDQFIADLNKSVEQRKKETGEDTLIVYYTDHMPRISYLFDGDEIMPRYRAPYTFYATYDLEKEKLPENFASYQLAYKAMEYAEVGYGPMEKFHKYMSDEKDYMKKLELVQYDLLFGKRYYLKESEKQKKNNIKMGVKDITIDEIKKEGNKYVIKGENFTPKSVLFVNDKMVDSKFIDSGSIETNEKINKSDEVCLKQLGKYNAELSSTNIYIYKGE